MHFDAVYYGRFWYSRAAGLSSDRISGNIQSEVCVHKFNLRLLSLLFKYIYVPRTHLITQIHPAQQEIANRVFASDEVAYLTERGVLVVSTNPGLDAYEDAERIASRASQTSVVRYASNTEYLRRIPRTAKLVIPTTAEQTARNIEGFHNYAEYRGFARDMAPISRKLQEIVKRSHLRDVPFFHEKFLFQLRELKPGLFDRIWRDTNSLYLTSGFTEKTPMISYYNEEMEDANFRHDPYNIDRYLVGPESIYALLHILLGEQREGFTHHVPIEQACFFLDPRKVHTRDLAAFRRSYFNLVKKLSVITAREPWLSDFHVPTIEKLLATELVHGFETQGRLAEGFVDDLRSTVLGFFGPAAGAAASFLKPVSRVASFGWQKLDQRARFPHIFRMADLLNQAISRASI